MTLVVCSEVCELISLIVLYKSSISVSSEIIVSLQSLCSCFNFLYFSSTSFNSFFIFYNLSELSTPFSGHLCDAISCSSFFIVARWFLSSLSQVSSRAWWSFFNLSKSFSYSLISFSCFSSIFLNSALRFLYF